MILADFSAPTPESSILDIFQRLGIAALVVPLAWGSLVFCFQLIVSRWITRPEQDGTRVEKTGILCIVFSIISSATAVFVLPRLSIDGTLVTNIIMWYHRFGVALLGDFLLLALFFQLKYSLQSQTWNDIRQARTVFKSWRLITETMPGPSAIIILFTGMQRVSAPGFSINLGWILLLVAILAIMMADGIFSYTPSIQNLAKCAEQNEDIHTFLGQSRNPIRKMLRWLKCSHAGHEREWNAMMRLLTNWPIVFSSERQLKIHQHICALLCMALNSKCAYGERY